MSSPADLFALSIEVCWRQWTTLGVSGVKTQESNHVIDPEALIVFTAILGDADPRLRDESTDWCVRYGPRLVSTSRLRNLAALNRDLGPLDEYFATVNANSATRWPTEHTPEPRDIVLSEKSKLPTLKKPPPLLRLQLRAMFGVTARAEVLMIFLTSRPSPEPFYSASDLQLTGYSKRNIAFVLDDLSLCELLTSRRSGNRVRYRLSERAHLSKLAPAAANASVTRWDLRFHLLASILRFAQEHGTGSRLARSVEARKLLKEKESVLEQLDLSAPTTEEPDAYWETLTNWVVNELIPPHLV